MRLRRFTAMGCLMMLMAMGRPALAGDTDCARSESGVPRKDWMHPMPPRGNFPPLSQVAPVGAFVALDERIFMGLDEVFHVIAMPGTRSAAEEFQSIGIDVSFDHYAEILARVMAPDGTVTEMTDADVTCRVESYQMAGYSIGKSSAPKHYVLNVRGLVPGSVLQYQVTKRAHRDSRWTIFWNYMYGNNHSFRDGSMQDLAYSPWENPFAQKSRYPAANVMFTYVIPVRMKFEYKLLNDNGKVKVTDIPKPNPDTERLIQFTYSRASLVSEPYEPYLRLQDPELITWVRSTDKTTQTQYKIYPVDWQEFVTQELPDAIAMLGVKGGVAAAREVAGCHDGLAVIDRVRCVNRHLRDRVTLANGNELRTSWGFRPPKYVIDSGRVASSLEKAMTLVATAREWGATAALVLARPSRFAAIDRAYPVYNWFTGYFVAVQTEGRWEFLYPVEPYQAGQFPQHFEGGEALLVQDRKTWEWIRLPGGAATAGGAIMEFDVEAIDSQGSRGTVAARWTGTEAGEWRAVLQQVAPQHVERLLSGVLEGEMMQGVQLQEVAVSNLASPDLPLEVRAKFSFSGALVMLGDKRKLRWLPGRIGPRASEFAASSRTRPIDFISTQRYESIVRIPAALAAGAELPAPVDASMQGMRFTLSGEKGEAGVTLRRVMEVTGTIPVAAYPQVRKFMTDAESADSVALGLGAAK